MAGHNLFHGSGAVIYKHVGGTASITETFSAPTSGTSGLTQDGTNLWSCDDYTQFNNPNIYGHAGYTATINTSFAIGTIAGDASGLTHDGTNLWSCNYTTNKVYGHSGNTATITTSFTAPTGRVDGLAFDGTNLWTCDPDQNGIYGHSGITSTVTTTLAAPDADVRGLTFDGTNLWSGGSAIYKHDGVTASVLLTISSGAAGLAWQPAEAPTVTTQAATLIGSVGCTGNGNITDTGGINPTRRGFCYVVGTSGDPDTTDDTAYDEDDYSTGAYTKAITGLTGNTSYRVRAYAVNSIGTSYGDTVQIKTTPPLPTDVAAGDDDSAKVVVTWTKSDGATAYQVYRDDVGLGWLGDVATYDDEEADPPVITPGSATATDGEHVDYVTLAVVGESIANGTTHTYKVVGQSASGNSDDSATDDGYRLAGALTYQWYRSAEDLDEDFATISAGTIEAYNDTEAPG